MSPDPPGTGTDSRMISPDTIAAVATAPGQGAISLVRLSGPQALAIANRVFHSRRKDNRLPPRRAVLGTIQDLTGAPVDEVLLTNFPGSASFTGEDTVEISCHGGVLVTRMVLQTVLAAGARLAAPGEFTQRAFLNGRMDLTQAEAVMDLIAAQTDLALRAAREQLGGRLGVETQAIRQDLLEVLAHVEAWIDFPEEDIDPDTGEALRTRISTAQQRCRQLLATADQGRILREGARTVLCGAPNAGKSSLLNVLLGFERAIVSETPGTTRDTIEEVINLRGLPLRLVDTAGLRPTEDAVEQEGVARTRQMLLQADLILEIVDASIPVVARMDIPAGATPHCLLVLNKSDLGLAPAWQREAGFPVSCRTGDGIANLCDAIFSLLTAGSGAFVRDLVAINARHQACLQRTVDFLTECLQELDRGASPEFIAIPLRAAMDAVGEITGRLDTEELLGEIFARFCIGK